MVILNSGRKNLHAKVPDPGDLQKLEHPNHVKNEMLPRCKFLSFEALIHPHLLVFALVKNENGPHVLGPRRPDRVAELVTASASRGQKVARGQRHAQVGIFVDWGLALPHRGVVMRFVAKKVILFNGNRENAAPPCKRAWGPDEGRVVLG